MLLRLGDAVPDRAKSWTAVPIRFNGTLPSLQVRLECGQEAFDEWLVMDTGSDLTVQLTRGSAETHRLHNSMKRLGSSRAGGTGDGTIRNEILLLPMLRLGNEELHELPIHVEESSGEVSRLGGRLGMDVLRRFNTTLDFRNDVAYLSPSTHYGNPYRAEHDSGRWWIALAFSATLFLSGGLYWFWRRFAMAHRP
jgi:hypothetical protein